MTLVAGFKIPGRLFQVLGPLTFVGRTRNYTIYTNRIEKLIKIVSSLIVVKFKNIEDNDIDKVRQRKQPSMGILGKDVLKICRKLTGEHPC